MRARPLLLGLAGAFALAQLVPVSRTNPPVEQEVDAPPGARAVLERSCFDCHSHATRWPWYSWVAPVSWLLAHDVSEAREHLNFSTWGRYDAKEREEKLEEIAEVLEEGEMPPWFYLPLHPEARLSEADLAAVRAWTGPGDGPEGRGHEERGH
jgi:mono/diheme cytochrome c family protein